MAERKERVRSRAKQHLDRNSHRDMAPGESNILFRKDEMAFYMPNVLHTAPTMNCDYLPIRVRDLLKAKDPRSVYNLQRRNALSDGVAMYGNHPIRKVCILGKIIDENYTENKSKIITHFLSVNDGSCAEVISVKIPRSMYISNHLNFDHNEDKLVQIRGAVAFFVHNTTTDFANQVPEIHSHWLDVVGDKRDNAVEFEWWKKVMQAYRQYLETPWVSGETEGVDREKSMDVKQMPEDVNHGLASVNVEVANASLGIDLTSLGLEFVSLLVKMNSDTLSQQQIYTDKELRHTVVMYIRSNGHADKDTLQKLYKHLIKTFVKKAFLKVTGSIVDIRPFRKVVKYVENFIGFVIQSQENEVRQHIGPGRANVSCSLSIKFLLKSIQEKFGEVKIESEHVSQIVHLVITGDSLRNGGVSLVERDEANFHVCTKWVYDLDADQWICRTEGWIT